jgi:hypothetical protein
MTTRFRIVLVLLVLGLLPMLAGEVSPTADAQQQLDCTFTVERPVVNLRNGPGVVYERVGTLTADETLRVIGEAVGDDGYIWWEGPDDTWVRSDLGSSDCPAICGNDVCEYGEDAASCADDCGSGSGTTAASSDGDYCLVPDCQACYESVDCYPDCSDCTCSSNAYGCVTCYCSYPDDDTGTGCTFGSCDECIAAFPCFPGPCTFTECTLNEFGCPVCETGS